MDDVATVLIGTFSGAKTFLYSSPDLCLGTILSLRFTHNSLVLLCSYGDAPEIHFECHDKGCEYLCTRYIFYKFARMLSKCLSTLLLRAQVSKFEVKNKFHLFWNKALT